jgi:hypothetical protein
MKSIVLNPPTFGFIVATRAVLAAGVALLVSSRLSASRRRTIGTALAAVGAATTVPAAIFLKRAAARGRRRSTIERDERLIGATRFARKGDDELM